MYTLCTGKLPGGGNYEGPPIHTLTVFANPFIEEEPDIFGEGVLVIEPGEEVPMHYCKVSMGGATFRISNF